LDEQTKSLGIRDVVMRVNKEDEYTVVPIPAMHLIALDVGFRGEVGSFLN
jgi:hypothetical protein